MSGSSRILVIMQFICLLFLIGSTEIVSTGVFLVVQLVGLFLSLWSVWIMKLGKFNIQPELKTNAVLVSSGPYKMIRNPMYCGIIIFFGASVANAFNVMNLLVLILLILVFLLKIIKEEKFMLARFGNEYVAYQKRTYRLVPFLF